MCDPVSIAAGIGAALQAGGAILEYEEQQKAHWENRKAAEESARRAMGLISRRQQQEAEAATQTILQMDMEARRAEAMTRLAAGEAGVAGTSVDVLLADIERQRAMAERGTKENLKNTIDQLEQEKAVVAANKQHQVNAVPAPNPWSLGIRIGGAALDGATSFASHRSRGAGGVTGGVGAGNLSTRQRTEKSFNEG